MSDIVKRESLGGDEVAVIDDGDNQSVYNLVPGSVQKYIENVPEQVWDMSFSDLSRQVKPTMDLKKLRLAFWLEYERAVRNGNQINFHSVAKGIVSPTSFMKSLSDFYRCAYIMTPPEDYRVKLEEMLILALEEERKILEQPLESIKTHISKKGDVFESKVFDTKLGDLKHKIRESLQTRLFGAPVQRTLSKNINQNYNGSDEVSNPTPQDLEAEIERLKALRDSKFVDVGGTMEGDDGGIKDDEHWQKEEDQS